MTAGKARLILASLLGYVDGAPVVTLAQGQVVVTVGQRRWLAQTALDVMLARTVAEHGARGAA